MNRNPRHRSRNWLVLLALLLVPIAAAPALASTGYPPSLHLLTQAAELTAHFNAGQRTVDTYPSNLPFQVLYVPSDSENNTGGAGQTFYVRPGTMLYVPVMYNDNSPPVLGGDAFPAAGDRAALLNYFSSQDLFGLVYARIAVDGKVVSLGPDYIVEVGFPDSDPLPDTATLYQAVAALLTPLPKGTHSIEVSVEATGNALLPYFPDGFTWSTVYTVIVE